MPRKRQLTDAEKDDIWRFHKEHPLVTHTDVAKFFGVERSTVSKIVHQDPYRNSLTNNEQSTTPQVAITRDPPPSLEAQTALDDYLQESERRGFSVTKPMLCKKAAIVAAKTWMERSQYHTARNMVRGSPCAHADTSSSSESEASPGSFSNAFFGSFQLDECEKWIRDQLACHDTRFSPGEFEDITDQLLQSSGTSTTNNFMGSPTDPTWSMVEANNLQHNMPSTEEKSTQVDVNQALNILSQHLANSDKLTTCDMICLSHLQDRVQSLTTDGSSSLNL